MNILVRPHDLKDGKVIDLLEEHHREMHRYSPPESIHALKKSDFYDLSLKFWSAWDGEHLAACGALRHLSKDHGEIKSMRTSKEYLRKGIAEKVLVRIVEEARLRDYKRLSLETGSNGAFIPAINLYKKHGFQESGPFGSYKPDPYSKFFTLEISNAKNS